MSPESGRQRIEIELRTPDGSDVAWEVYVRLWEVLPDIGVSMGVTGGGENYHKPSELLNTEIKKQIEAAMGGVIAEVKDKG